MSLVDAPTNSRLRVYLVDDEPKVLSALRRSLRHAPVEIQTFESARTAMAAAMLSPPDVIVADFQMPDVNGPQLLEELRRRIPQVRRVLLSASGLSLSPAMARVADLVMLKPWTERTIRLAIGLSD
jgi:response regulator RpfG family c-di-GMP phosphodiesterase